MKVRLDQFNNDWFYPGGKLKIALWTLFSITFIRTAFPWPIFIKKLLLQLFGCKLGKGFVIKPQVNIKYPWKLTIGDYVWLGENVWIDNLGNVEIHDHVCISQGAMLLTGNHDYKKSSFDLKVEKILLKSGVWIGANSVVCPGVVCRENSVLSVSSVATKDLIANKIYQGNPATQKKVRF